MSAFTDRLAIRRAQRDAEWAAAHAPLMPTNADPLNPHHHYADTSIGTRCLVRPDYTCHVPHKCRCQILWDCSGGCYR